MNILLIDDENSFIEDFVELAVALGHNVFAFREPDEAWPVIMSSDICQKPDVGFIDYSLIEERGTEIIRKARVHGVVIPLVLLTLHDDQDVAFEAGISGASDFCNKHDIRTGNELQGAIERAVDLGARNREVAIRESVEYYRNIARFLEEFIHDVKNVFVPITLAAKVSKRSMEEHIGQDRGSPILDRALVELGHIIRLVEDGKNYLAHLREFTKSGKTNLTPSIISMSCFISECVKDFVINPHRVNVNVLVDRVYIDESAVKRILQAILTNINDHTDDDTLVEINVTSFRRSDVQILRISIRDYGLGIPQELRVSVFDPGVCHNRKSKENMGLGLSIAKRFTELHSSENARGVMIHGLITCDAAPDGEGALFIVDLPVDATTEEIHIND